MQRCATVLRILVLVSLGGCAKADDSPEARAVVDRAIQASGGADKLAALGTATWKGKGTVHAGDKEIAITGDWFVQLPHQARVELADEVGGRTNIRVLVLDGERGWSRLNDSAGPLGKRLWTEEREQFYLHWLATLTPLTERASRLKFLGERKVGERNAVGVRVARESYRDVDLFFDAENHLLLMARSIRKDLRVGKEVEQELFFSDYKSVAGAKRPMKLRLMWDAKPFFDLEISDLSPRERLNEQLFKQP